MEIKATLNKPYTENQRIDFIVEQNHNKGYVIEETETLLQALGYTQEELEQQEKERVAKLFLTGADVERGIYKAKGMDFEDIIEYVTSLPIDGLNIKELKIELKANNFYRGNPYVSAIGKILGFTPKQLDNFFEYNDYLYLTSCTLNIVATPSEAIIKLNGVEQNSITVPYMTEVLCEISCEGYETQQCTTVVKEDRTSEFVLVKEEEELPAEEIVLPEEPVEGVENENSTD